MTDERLESATRAISEKWNSMHSNESLGRQRMLAQAALSAADAVDPLRNDRVSSLSELDASAVRTVIRTTSHGMLEKVEQNQHYDSTSYEWRDSEGLLWSSHDLIDPMIIWTPRKE